MQLKKLMNAVAATAALTIALNAQAGGEHHNNTGNAGNNFGNDHSHHNTYNSYEGAPGQPVAVNGNGSADATAGAYSGSNANLNGTVSGTLQGGTQTMNGGNNYAGGGAGGMGGGGGHATSGDVTGTNTGNFTNNPTNTLTGENTNINKTGPSNSNANGTNTSSNTATNGGNSLGTSYNNKNKFIYPATPGTLIGNVQGECMGQQGFAIGAYLGSISFLNPKFNTECADFIAKMKELNQGHEKEMLTKAQVHEMTMEAVRHAFGDKGTPLEQAAWTIRISEFEIEIHDAFVMAARAEQEVIAQKKGARYIPTDVMRAHFLNRDLKAAPAAPAAAPTPAPAP